MRESTLGSPFLPYLCYLCIHQKILQFLLGQISDKLSKLYNSPWKLLLKARVPSKKVLNFKSLWRALLMKPITLPAIAA
jgi:hypothetical protein